MIVGLTRHPSSESLLLPLLLLLLLLLLLTLNVYNSTTGDEAIQWMAWKKRHGMTKEAAMNAYIDQVNLLEEEVSGGM